MESRTSKRNIQTERRVVKDIDTSIMPERHTYHINDITYKGRSMVYSKKWVREFINDDTYDKMKFN